MTTTRRLQRASKSAGAHWHLVDVGAILDVLAVERNELQDALDRPLRNYYAGLGMHRSPAPAPQPGAKRAAPLTETANMANGTRAGCLAWIAFTRRRLGME